MRGSSLGLELYADSDYADKSNDRLSVYGMAVTLGGTVVSHASKHSRSCSFQPQRSSWGRGQGRSICACR